MKRIKRIRDSDVRASIERLNKRNNTVYPNIGYVYYADIKGDGTHEPRVYKIINADGGVILSTLNGRTKRETVININATV